jgi:hypothetical protein
MQGRCGGGCTAATVDNPALPAPHPVMDVLDELRCVRHGLGRRHLDDGEHAELQSGLRISEYAGINDRELIRGRSSRVRDLQDCGVVVAGDAKRSQFRIRQKADCTDTF